MDNDVPRPTYLITSLFQAFEWFDESLQNSLIASGQPALTQPESLVMIHVYLGIVRPADIARSLRVTRQAVHFTINTLVQRGIFALEDDPEDGRIRQVVTTPLGNSMREDARQILKQLTEQLEKRIGKRAVASLLRAFAADWGEPMVIALRQTELPTKA